MLGEDINKIYTIYSLIENKHLSNDEQKQTLDTVITEVYQYAETCEYTKTLMDCSNLIKNLIE